MNTPLDKTQAITASFVSERFVVHDRTFVITAETTATPPSTGQQLVGLALASLQKQLSLANEALRAAAREPKGHRSWVQKYRKVLDRAEADH